MSIKARLDKLEQHLQSQWVQPFAVEQREGETLEEAVNRALDGHLPPKNWTFALFPERLSHQDWEAKYSPD